jgi:hypothetical protein
LLQESIKNKGKIMVILDHVVSLQKWTCYVTSIGRNVFFFKLWRPYIELLIIGWCVKRK